MPFKCAIPSGGWYVRSKLEIINDGDQIGVVKEEKRITDESNGMRSDLNIKLEDSLCVQSHRRQAKGHSKTNDENVIVLLIWESSLLQAVLSSPLPSA